MWTVASVLCIAANTCDRVIVGLLQRRTCSWLAVIKDSSSCRAYSLAAGFIVCGRTGGWLSSDWLRRNSCKTAGGATVAVTRVCTGPVLACSLWLIIYCSVTCVRKPCQLIACRWLDAIGWPGVKFSSQHLIFAN